MVLSIVIVNFKTPLLLISCIESVVNTIVNTSYEIIVVDNNSKDNSEELIRSRFNNVNWINNSLNEGFGRANNIGINRSIGEYILLLNSDVVVEKNTIEKCLNQFRLDKSIGALGCILLNEDGSIQKSTYQYIASYYGVIKNNLIYDYLSKQCENNDFKIEAIMGAFMMIPRKVLNKTGLFDPDFFMYAEEMELCKRILKSGYKISYFDQVTAFHKNGGSSENLDWSKKQAYLSEALLYYKIKGFFGYILYHLLWFMNTVSNFCVMWFLSPTYRTGYFKREKWFYSNIRYYFLIPFQYNKKWGGGIKALQRLNN